MDSIGFASIRTLGLSEDVRAHDFRCLGSRGVLELGRRSGMQLLGRRSGMQLPCQKAQEDEPKIRALMMRRGYNRVLEYNFSMTMIRNPKEQEN